MTVMCAAVMLLASSCIRKPAPQFGKVQDYLYEYYLDEYSMDAIEAASDMVLLRGDKTAACTAVRYGNLFGRNFDWYYGKTPDFVTYTAADSGRYASLSMISPILGLKDRTVRKAHKSLFYKLLPAFTVDGMNENGVACCINVAPGGDCGRTEGTNPGAEPLCMPYIVRFVLDNARSVDHALELLSERNIYAPFKKNLLGEYHFMIADTARTVVLEFIDNKMSVLEDEKVMTNFYNTLGVTPHTMGIERYNVAMDGYDRCSTLEGMKQTLYDARITQIYSGDGWFSDFCNPGNKHKATYSADWKDNPRDVKIMQREIKRFIHRRRNGKTWQTFHTAIYDLENLTLTVSPQESGVFYDYTLK